MGLSYCRSQKKPQIPPDEILVYTKDFKSDTFGKKQLSLATLKLVANHHDVTVLGDCLWSPSWLGNYSCTALSTPVDKISHVDFAFRGLEPRLLCKRISCHYMFSASTWLHSTSPQPHTSPWPDPAWSSLRIRHGGKKQKRDGGEGGRKEFPNTWRLFKCNLL